MGRWGAFFFGEEDEIKVKQLMEVYKIDEETAKEIFVKNMEYLESKKN